MMSSRTLSSAPFLFVLTLALLVPSLTVLGQEQKPAAKPKSTTLSRSNAALLIRSSADFKATFDAKVVVGTFWSDSKVNDAYPSFAPLVRSGILTFRETGKVQNIFCKEYVAELTPAGQTESSSWVKTSKKPWIFTCPEPNASIFRIPLAERELVEVTGIATQPGGTEAEIELTWKWAPTPGAKFLPAEVPSPETHGGKVYAKLYDDGWRLVKFRLVA